MFYGAKNGSITMGDTSMDYIRFGCGSRNLLLLPGVGDGLKTVKGMAVPFAIMYRKLAKRFKVYAFSRRNDLPEGYTTREMAEDIHAAMIALHIEKACVVGVSLGGMIAQHLAIRHPESVDKLILTVTLSRQNKTVQSVVGGWIDMAQRGDFKGIMLDTAEKSYSEKYLKRMRWMYALIGHFGKPKSLDRFITMANACITHDAYASLAGVICPTLIVGGTQDKIVTGEASKDMYEQIKGSKLLMYEGLGHGLYEEAKDYLERMIAFCA
ncbi:MAG: alpha/beta hydrolase [Clostridia bacterium]|nr:alpha/beta hydrolase [Clostridia bacterium]